MFTDVYLHYSEEWPALVFPGVQSRAVPVRGNGPGGPQPGALEPSARWLGHPVLVGLVSSRGEVAVESARPPLRCSSEGDKAGALSVGAGGRDFSSICSVRTCGVCGGRLGPLNQIDFF